MYLLLLWPRWKYAVGFLWFVMNKEALTYFTVREIYGGSRTTVWKWLGLCPQRRFWADDVRIARRMSYKLRYHFANLRLGTVFTTLSTHFVLTESLQVRFSDP